MGGGNKIKIVEVNASEPINWNFKKCVLDKLNIIFMSGN